MPQLFPRALVTCIRDGRPPEPAEVSAVAQRLWDECAGANLTQSQVATLARVALFGCAPFADEAD